MQPAGLLGFAALSFLPGAWLAYGLRLPGASFGARALLAIVVSPVVVLGQFYIVRGFGVPFDAAVVVLLLVNLPALVPILRCRARLDPAIDAGEMLLYALVWVVPVGLLFFYFHDLAANALRAHTFLHADLVYGLADGDLKVEDAQLAGLTSGYPWGGHVHQAVVSHLWGTSPVANYAWTNLLLLVGGITLMACVTGRLGGGGMARLLTIVWVLFAVNAVGHGLREFVVPEELARTYPVWGDGRFTPWMRKYSLWNQHPHAQALFAGILYFMMAPRSEAYARSALFLVCVMAAGLAAIYATFMPAVGVLLAARLAWDVFERDDRSLVRRLRESVPPLAVIGVVGILATLGVLWVVGEDRAAGAGLGLSSMWELKVKSAETAISFALLFAGVLALLAARRRALPERWGVLLLAGLASALLFVVVSIRGRIEYKFVFTAAMCLAPLAALGFDAWIARRGSLVATLYALVLLFMVAAGADKFIRLRYTGDWDLTIRVDEFTTRLAAGHELEGAVERILERTSPRTVLAVDSAEVHLPIFTRRSLYAPPRIERPLLGVDLGHDLLLAQNRGYGEDILERRLAVTRRLFRAETSAERIEALEEIRRLGRPVAVLLEPDRHAGLLETLLALERGETIYRNPRWAVWVEDDGARD